MYTFLFQSTVFNKPSRLYVVVKDAKTFMERASHYLNSRRDPVIWPLLNLDDIDEIRSCFPEETCHLETIKPEKSVILKLKYKGIDTEVMEISMNKEHNWVLFTSMGKMLLPMACCQFYFKE